MKLPYDILRHISLLVFAFFIVACANDADTSGGGEGREKVLVKFNIRPSAKSTTRFDNVAMGNATWDDENVADGEMMKNCFVVVVQGGKIQNILTSSDYQKEQSYVSTLATRLEPGATTIYSFANIRPEDVGLDANATFPCDLPDGFDNQYYSLEGNQSSIDGFTDGIPMSNRQDFDITERTQEVDLEVVRMVAKVRLRLTNVTPNDFSVKSVSLSDITANAAGNIRLLPSYSADSQIQPAISPSAAKTEYRVSFDKARLLKSGGTESLDIDFYVNESVASTPKYFVVNVETDQTSVTHRVALLKWDTIVRGDFLLIPIKLNDYRITYDVEQFTAIGVLPSVENNRDMLTVRFHGYGDFHMRPHVVRISDGKELTPGTNSTDGWWLVDWSVLEMNPNGGDGVSIYDKSPAADHTRRMFEGTIGNRKGYAIHQVLFGVYGVDYAIPYKVQIIRE